MFSLFEIWCMTPKSTAETHAKIQCHIRYATMRLRNLTRSYVKRSYAYVIGVLDVVLIYDHPDSKVHGANMGPAWVLSAPDGPHGGPRNLAIWAELVPVVNLNKTSQYMYLMVHDTRFSR